MTSVGYSPLLSEGRCGVTIPKAFDQRGAGRHDVCGKRLDAFVKRTLLRRGFENE